MIMKEKNLDSTWREKQKSILINVITKCMNENVMTLENLFDACEGVVEVYIKNATI